MCDYPAQKLYQLYMQWGVFRDGLKAVLSRQRQRSRQWWGKAAMSLTETRQRQRAQGRDKAD